MPTDSGSRWSIDKPLTGDPVSQLRLSLVELIEKAESQGALIDRGTLASRPVSSPGTPGIVGRLYIISDEGERVDLDYGTGWVTIWSPTGDEGLARLYSSYVATEESITSGTLALAPTPDTVTFTPPAGAYFWLYILGAMSTPSGTNADIGFYMNGSPLITSLVNQTNKPTFLWFYHDDVNDRVELGPTSTAAPTDATPAKLGSAATRGLLMKAGADPDPVTFEWRYARSSGSGNFKVKHRHILAVVAAGQ